MSEYKSIAQIEAGENVLAFVLRILVEHNINAPHDSPLSEKLQRAYKVISELHVAHMLMPHISVMEAIHQKQERDNHINNIEHQLDMDSYEGIELLHKYNLTAEDVMSNACLMELIITLYYKYDSEKSIYWDTLDDAITEAINLFIQEGRLGNDAA